MDHPAASWPPCLKAFAQVEQARIEEAENIADQRVKELLDDDVLRFTAEVEPVSNKREGSDQGHDTGNFHGSAGINILDEKCPDSKAGTKNGSNSNEDEMKTFDRHNKNELIVAVDVCRRLRWVVKAVGF